MDLRRLLPYLLGLTACAVLATALVVFVSQRSASPGQAAEDSNTELSATGPRQVLADWDQQRSTVWAQGDVEGLRELYVTDSATGRADARMLAAYVDRGLHVERLATQVLALEVLDEGTDDLLVRVTDRVIGGVVAGDGTWTPLPRDRPTVRTLALRRVDGVWLMDSVRDQARAATRTSRTSTSWKS